MSDLVLGMEYLPNVFIDNIDTIPSGLRQEAIVHGCIYDLHENPGWSIDERFLGFLKVGIIIERNPEKIEELKKGNIPSELLFVNDNVDFYQNRPNHIPHYSYSVLNMRTSEESIRGIKYKKFKFKTEKFSFNAWRSKFYVFAFSYIDTQEVIDTLGLDLGFSSTRMYHGTISGEIIYNLGSIPQTSYIKDIGSPDPWIGPIRKPDTPQAGLGTTGDWIMGSNNSFYVDPLSVDLMPITANKITSFTEFPEVDRRQVDMTNSDKMLVSGNTGPTPSSRSQFEGGTEETAFENEEDEPQQAGLSAEELAELNQSQQEKTDTYYTEGDEYQLEDGTPYVGFYHFHQGHPMTGEEHGSEPNQMMLYPLETEENYYEGEVQQHSLGGGSSAKTMTTLGPFFNNVRSFSGVQNKAVSFPSPYHQSEFVEDADRNVSNVVILDLENISLRNSKHAQLLFKHNKKIFSLVNKNCNIKGIEVKRIPLKQDKVHSPFGMPFPLLDHSGTKVIAKSNNSSRTLKTKTLYLTPNNKKISIAPSVIRENKLNELFDGKKITRALVNDSTMIGKIENVNLTLPSNLRAIKFVDYSINDNIDGKYKYSINVKIDDQSYKYCVSILKKLIHYGNKIENLSNVIIMKNAYDGEKFIPSFLNEFYSQYNIDVDESNGMLLSRFDTELLNKSFLVDSFNVLMIAEKLLGTSVFSKAISNSLNLFSTSPEKILNTSNYFNKVISKFKDMYELSDGQSFEKSSTSSGRKKELIEQEILLKEEYERKISMPIGMNFIFLDKTHEVPTINSSFFRQRADIEVSKFFETSINKRSDVLSPLTSQEKTAFANIDSSKFKYFSPAKIFFKDKQIDTTIINSDSFDADLFNSMRVVKRALEANESVEEDSMLDEKEEIENEDLIDSRDYLGSATKFNRLLINQNSVSELKITRNRFPSLDNKMLKAKTKPITLKLFNPSQPENLVSRLGKQNLISMPLQLKALTMIQTPTIKYDIDKIEFDPISNVQTQAVFEQNFLNIMKVEYLLGFNRMNGVMNMEEPIYKEFETNNLSHSQNKNCLCRIVEQNIEGLQVSNRFVNIHDKVFVMENTKKMQMNSKIPDDPADYVQISNTGQPESTGYSKVEYTTLPINQNFNNYGIAKEVVPRFFDVAVIAPEQTTPSPQASEPTISPTINLGSNPYG
mgnify:CR=1 FL=1|tara:strand:- start:9567 stop:13088 length:3522 start_codon:yes stop_codon:yes gene_type:complete